MRTLPENSLLRIMGILKEELFKGLRAMKQNNILMVGNFSSDTGYAWKRNKKISKIRYIVEQYFGISHLHDQGQRARFTTIAKNNIDIWFRQVAYNIRRGFTLTKRLSTA